MKIIAASHGYFASGIKSSVEILLGNTDKLIVIDAYLDQHSIEEKLDELFESIPDTEQVVMLSDLYGGSVNQKMYLRLSRPNTFLIAGMNLALVLQLLLKTEPLNHERLKEIVEESRKALTLVELQSTSVEEKDFFGGSE